MWYSRIQAVNFPSSVDQIKHSTGSCMELKTRAFSQNYPIFSGRFVPTNNIRYGNHKYVSSCSLIIHSLARTVRPELLKPSHFRRIGANVMSVWYPLDCMVCTWLSMIDIPFNRITNWLVFGRLLVWENFTRLVFARLPDWSNFFWLVFARLPD